MTRCPVRIVGCLLLLAKMAVQSPCVLANATSGQDDPVKAAAVKLYQTEVKPLLKSRCYACHGTLKQEAGLRLDTAEWILRGSETGAIVDLETPAESALLQRVSAADSALRMPPQGHPLTSRQVQWLREWVDAGAPGPMNETPEADPRRHWAFQKIQRPQLPKDADLIRPSANPIDVWIGDRLRTQGLVPLPRASKPVRLRRLYLDLIGIPPTADQLHDFLSDESPDAYQRVVQQLLDDPRYGQRWARHWMDVWRYSDWYGRRHVPDVWNSAPQIWRWRDWIVDSLNADKGYDQMVREMLAGDEVRGEDPKRAVATGYLVRNWYALNPNDWMRNTVEHTSKAFLGLTLNCAHCHDHKYDPIEQDDYFRFRAFFEPMYVRQDQVAGEADPGPFQDYQYSTLRKVQHLGAVRVFDRNPEAPTWFYTDGDERNRVESRGSISPGIPGFLGVPLPDVEEVVLPVPAWYPGLGFDMQRALRRAAQQRIQTAQAQLQQAQQEVEAPSEQAIESLQAIRSKLEMKRSEGAGAAQRFPSGQALLLDASHGRRIVQKRLPDLKAFGTGVLIRFEVNLASDAHFNFQLAKDADQGLTAAYVGFENGRLLSYRPGTFQEFEVGTFRRQQGQSRLRVTLKVDVDRDVCHLQIRSLNDDQLLVSDTRVALNGWNPVNDPSKAITFDARTGSLVAVDEVRLEWPDPRRGDEIELLTIDFESPGYQPGQDVVGFRGWEASKFCQSPATSKVANHFPDAELARLTEQFESAKRQVEFSQLRVDAAAQTLLAAKANLASLEARLTAELARYGQEPDRDWHERARLAAHAEYEFELQNRLAVAASDKLNLARAEARSLDDPKRDLAIQEARKAWDASQAAVETCKANRVSPASEEYTPLGPTYPRTSTGRRAALAQWITHRDNPLTARVAVNHIWLRHFHAPLVETVYDFGRNGTRPTHPRLLDWLATELMEANWSMKHLHRLIVSSEAYQRRSSIERLMLLNDQTHPNDAGAKRINQGLPTAAPSTVDPDNHFWWRMNVGRMEAETLRDSLLHCAGLLDSRFAGRPLANQDAATSTRRSLYFEVFPEQGGSSQMGRLFDPPNPLECYRRTQSIVPQQALALSNSELVHRLSRHIVMQWTSSQSLAEAETEELRFIEAAFTRILTRAPTPDELDLCRQALARQTAIYRREGRAGPREAACSSLIRALFNHNDFITIR